MGLGPDPRLILREEELDTALELLFLTEAALWSAADTALQAELAGLGPYFFFPYTQFLNGVNVIDSNDKSKYNALEMKLERRFANGYGNDSCIPSIAFS